MSADAVVIATGSQGAAAARRARRGAHPAHPGRRRGPARRTRARDGGRVVGAGFIGAEVASTLHGSRTPGDRGRGGADAAGRPARPGTGRGRRRAARTNGVPVRCGVGVTGFRVAGSTGAESGATGRRDGRVSGVELADGTVVPADVVVVGIGADPAVDWLDGSGLDAVRRRGVLRGRRDRGARDLGGRRLFGLVRPPRGRPHRVEHWTDSRERPAALARALLGRHAPEPAGAVLLVRPVRRPDPVRRSPAAATNR